MSMAGATKVTTIRVEMQRYVNVSEIYVASQTVEAPSSDVNTVQASAHVPCQSVNGIRNTLVV
jgi:hypothetical protein